MFFTPWEGDVFAAPWCCPEKPLHHLPKIASLTILPQKVLPLSLLLKRVFEIQSVNSRARGTNNRACPLDPNKRTFNLLDQLVHSSCLPQQNSLFSTLGIPLIYVSKKSVVSAVLWSLFAGAQSSWFFWEAGLVLLAAYESRCSLAT